MGFFDRTESNVLLKESYSGTDEEAIAAANRVVATIGSEKLTNGQLQIFYWGQVFDFLSENSYYLSYLGWIIPNPWISSIMRRNRDLPGNITSWTAPSRPGTAISC